MQNRREFLIGTMMAGVAGAAAANPLVRASRNDAALGAPMIGFACKPMPVVRVGVVGCGNRGLNMIKRASKLPGVRVTAVCDIRRESLDFAQELLQQQGLSRARVFMGPEAYRRLCDFDEVDVVYNTTPWNLHVPVARAAMAGGKHVFTEVTAAMTVEECWEMVETAEKNRLHCMQLENCIYGEIEMLTFNLYRQGLLGEITNAEGAYNHDGRCMINDLFPSYQYWRYDHYRDHAGNPYPTHGLVPLCLTMDVNRGDRFDYIVSMDSKEASFSYFMEHAGRKRNPRLGQKVKMGDMSETLIRTVNGKTIHLQHTVGTPRPYSRLQIVSGTRGIVADYPFRIALESKCGDNRAHDWMDEKAAEEIRAKYRHPLWKSIGEIAKKAGGHGGMDFIQDYRWAYCLRAGLPLDTTVYDLATTGCLCELTERSATGRSCALDVPDFTRGAWKTAPKMPMIDVDPRKLA